jgi:uncharacterized OB-fold protein
MRDAPTRGRIYSFTVIHHAAHPAVASSVPYVVAVIEFPGLPGIRFISNVTDTEPQELAIGIEVELWWDEQRDGYLPRFRPTSKRKT